MNRIRSEYMERGGDWIDPKQLMCGFQGTSYTHTLICQFSEIIYTRIFSLLVS